ncbi:Twin-arginine translocation pathway signal [Rubrobacter xylanophilus DSM 9941]|uniref:Twin-arginine translocation pathway signal n=1 Tax=Rubrobacter xylanophilus (strain DSM 9941 / JCM 11954 / NBRC 16129 / PRD-1) TaxID=266117 RepID=Q1AXP5_RUBXD|nr:peptide ABC transporter substrate-binding protein [Rubrobacter xylanophilus]ABG03833.1 Twin-arginine translocation pathway signal [Rubrobacter xylanophilus DSM 9941]
MARLAMSGGGRRPAGAFDLTRRDFLKLGGGGLVGAALLSASGCNIFGGGQQGGSGGGGNGVIVNLGDTIRDLDSTTTTDSVSTDILLNVMSGLYRLDPDQQPVPDMAESHEVSEDKLTYTFRLREGIKWSNGEPVTSQDFKYAWLRAMDPDTAGQYAYILTTFIKGGPEFNGGPTSEEDKEEHDRLRDNVAIETPDDRTLRVTLQSPSPFWLGLTSFFTYLPQKQSFVEEQGEQYAQNADALLYNGPYILTEFNPTEGVTMVKRDDYWDAGSVDIRRVEGKIVKEEDTAVNLYESGGLDVTEITGQYVQEYKGTPDFYSQTFFATFYMVPNVNRVRIFRNLNVRKAIQMGFDRRALVDQILRNGSEPATGLVPAGIDGPGDQTFRQAQGNVMPDFDPERARRLFQQGIEEVGENPTVELLAYDDSTARDIATFLQNQFQENLGMKTRVKVQPFDRKLELEANGEFELSWQGWIADYNDPMTFLDLFLSDSSFNTGGYSNPRYDRLINQAKEETDFARRMQQMLEAERILVAEDAGTAPMYFDGEASLIRPTIKNYVEHKYGAGIDVKWWRLEE